MTFPFLSPEEFDEQAHQLYDGGEYDQALEVLREGLQRYPDATELHVGLGYVRIAREEYLWARRSFQTALDLDAQHEDAWVGLGEALLKFGHLEEAQRCFARVDELGLGDDLELGLAIGRALYREALFRESRQRLARLAFVHPENAEVRAALGYTLHALGDELAARRELRAALGFDPSLHEVRIYLAHLLFERGDLKTALLELERVPANEHWDPLSLWRYIELKCSIDGYAETDERLQPWRDRWEELQVDPDPVDQLLAEVETAFEQGGVEPAPRTASVMHALPPARLLPLLPEPPAISPIPDPVVHRVRTADGSVFTGTWEEILLGMRDMLSDPNEPLSSFMRRAAQRVRRLTGRDLPCDDAESFLRESARIGLLKIED